MIHKTFIRTDVLHEESLRTTELSYKKRNRHTTIIYNVHVPYIAYMSTKKVVYDIYNIYKLYINKNPAQDFSGTGLYICLTAL